MTTPLKPDADRIAARLKSLENEPWLGAARAWWPAFLFHTTDVENAARILESGKLLSRSRCEALGLLSTDSASKRVLDQTDPHWKDYVRLYFRPRTPFQFHNEGFRPLAQRGPLEAHCPVPIVFLFDSLSILSRRDVLFSNGNLAARGAEIGSTAEFFEHLPFQQIYHDTWLSDDEKRSVVFSRHAEVAVRDELDLGPLLRIWCRSAAERETLQSLVSSSIWASYAQRIGSSARPNLFFRRWTFVEHAVLSDERINLRLNPSSRTPGPFSARLELFDGESLIAHWSDLAFASTKYGKTGDLIVRLPQRLTSYTVRFLLDELLVYAGSYAQEQDRVALF